MEYRKLDKLGIEISLLGFGCMRFPLSEDGSINEVESEKMIDKAIAEGVNYIDTAYPYHNGDSEPFVGKVLRKYDRSTYYLATKLPCWEIKSVADAERIFDQQLERLGQEYVDFYLLHALNRDRFNEMKELGIVEFCEKLKEEGKIRYLGFSFHDDYDAFEEILTYRDWDFCQIQYNYMDTEEQAGDKGYELTEKLGIPVIIMEPIKGGSLAELPEDITAIFKEADPKASVASWALRFVASRKNVKTVLSGMSTYDQVLDNLDTFSAFKALTSEEELVVERVAATIKSRVKNGCTACRYCMPCPAGVDIPKNFAIWNHHAMYGNAGHAKWAYFTNFNEENRADRCISCGKCETVCPQKIAIRDDLSKVVSDMDKIK
ncbi:MAG TPA: aldo/keto reductase [Lachnospiraceae bacterium]|uniref:aldo/keto reductase n=1 Tax=Anaerosporobacter sp. TaxID=1872529 RepID=UPI000EF0EEDD|nr:aldo/keto reductase [Anaerosporobacter sp.]HAB59631.1 aldo/keto reductase [Lachnospiraceae bacterium]